MRVVSLASAGAGASDVRSGLHGPVQSGLSWADRAFPETNGGSPMVPRAVFVIAQVVMRLLKPAAAVARPKVLFRHAADGSVRTPAASVGTQRIQPRASITRGFGCKTPVISRLDRRALP